MRAHLLPRLPVIVLMVAALVIIPIALGDSFWLTLLNYAGITAIGALGLNLLTGYAGQVSIATGTFVGLGAYAAVWFGSRWGWPFIAWFIMAGALGGLLGALVGPFAFRLRGFYLVAVSLAIVFVGLYVFTGWTTLTGGNDGISVAAPVSIPGVNFAKLDLLGKNLNRDQGYFIAIWLLVALTAVCCRNLVRSGWGRAVQAVRENETAAAVNGVNVAASKLTAFIISSGVAAMSGGLLASYQRFVDPAQWSLQLSVEYYAVIVVGGIGTISGPILGAVFIGGLPFVIQQFSGSIPGVSSSGTGGGFITVYELNDMLFGLLIIIFLISVPNGVAQLPRAVSARLRSRRVGKITDLEIHSPGAVS